MKVKRLIIKNIGLIADTTIELDKPLILFYGDIMQGKTTILNSVKFCFGGAYPSDIIRHGQEEASVTLEFENGSLCREWYVGKDGIVNARPIVYIQDGKPVKRPVDEIKKLLNPFLLDQDHLRKMTELERKNYFTQLFAVDTSEIDTEYLKIENEAREIRAKIKGYGEIDLTEVKSVDVAPLKEELAKIKAANSRVLSEVNTANSEILLHNHKVSNVEKTIKEIKNQIASIEKRLSEEKKSLESHEKWLKENPTKAEKELPPMIGTTILEAQISEALANEVRVEQYHKNLTRNKEKEADKKTLMKMGTLIMRALPLVCFQAHR